MNDKNCNCGKLLQANVERIKDYESQLSELCEKTVKLKDAKMELEWYNLIADAKRSDQRWQRMLERNHRIFCLGHLWELIFTA